MDMVDVMDVDARDNHQSNVVCISLSVGPELVSSFDADRTRPSSWCLCQMQMDVRSNDRSWEHGAERVAIIRSLLLPIGIFLTNLFCDWQAVALDHM